jgi:hypothetical protein
MNKFAFPILNIENVRTVLYDFEMEEIILLNIEIDYIFTVVNKKLNQSLNIKSTISTNSSQ